MQPLELGINLRSPTPCVSSTTLGGADQHDLDQVGLPAKESGAGGA